MKTTLDHLVITAPSLDAGVAWIEDLFGITMSPGGKHPRMGTHNALLKVGPQHYLEVIAADPEQPAPNRDRWFGLDHLRQAATPTLVTWVARTTSIHETVQASPWNPSSVETMNRGTFQWSITIPSHAEWIQNSHLPLLIQWGDERHPTDLLPDAPIRLMSLQIFDPQPEELQTMLDRMSFPENEHRPDVRAGDAELRAEFQTPRGRVVVSSISGVS